MRVTRLFKQVEFAYPPKVLVASRCEAKTRSGSELESEARELLRALGAHKLAREIRVEWNPRLKTCAGRADYREKLISLNPLLLKLRDSLIEKGDEKLDR